MVNTMRRQPQKETERGIALLIAVVFSSLLMTVALSIYALTLAESDISSTERESIIAFYAADAGIECALYWDLQHDSFNPLTPATNITCLGNSATVGGGGATRTYSFSLSGSLCTDIEVTKTVSGGLIESTSIVARGYNTCIVSDSERTERAIEVSF